MPWSLNVVLQHASVCNDCPDAARVLVSRGQQYPIQANAFAIWQHVMQHPPGISLLPFRRTNTIPDMTAPGCHRFIRAMLYADHTDNFGVCCTHIKELGIVFFMLSDIPEPFLRILAVPEPPCAMRPVKAVRKLFILFIKPYRPYSRFARKSMKAAGFQFGQLIACNGRI